MELLADLRVKKQGESDEIIDNVPCTPEQIAMHNFSRGCCAVAKDLLGLEEEYRKWKEQTK